MRTAIAIATAIFLPIFGAPAFSQQGDGTDVKYPVSVFKPKKVVADADHIARLKRPDGFEVGIFASGLGNARIITVGQDGSIYISRREEGDIVMLKDKDGDGKADKEPVVVARRSQTHGMAIRENKFYLITVKELFVADIKADGTLGPLKMLVGDLPDSGQHPNRVIAFGPDGMLYISVGSTCNACNESNPENAAMLRATPDLKSRIIFATGLRNTIGFDWHPETGELWGLDHGIDFLGDEVQPEELNKLELGKQYGWPHLWGDGQFNPQSTPPGGITKEQWKKQSVPMVLGYDAHAAPMQFKFYTGDAFPAEYQGDAFATMRGSWNRNPASGYEIVRIHFEDGKPTSIEPFLTGFLSDGGKTHFARPVGLAIAKDGSLLMSDDANGVLYRVSHTDKNTKSSSLTKAPADEMEKQAAQGHGVPLANKRKETETNGKLKVQSKDIASGEMIPMIHSEYADGVAPEISWSKVKDARSYALIVEDPDAKKPKPFVHWLAWNIPSTLTGLPQGLQEQLRLMEPEGVLQGRNSRGSMGYLGPKPPVGDPPHRYHFQVLALDKTLDLEPGADRDELLAAAAGHVIAKGELVGLYQQEIDPPKQ